MSRFRFACSAVAVAVLASAAASAAPTTPPKPAGKRVALLVGVTNYDHKQLREPKLEYPENDVRELADVLRKAGYDDVVVLSSTASEPELLPTKEHIETRLTMVLQGLTTDDLVVIAFAGHGLQIQGEDYFCPSDGNPRRAETLVSLGGVLDDVGKSKAAEKVLLMDACREDPMAGRGVVGSGTPMLAPGVAVLYACSRNERAFEDKAWKHGAFFAAVLTALKGDAADKDGAVDYDALAKFVSTAVPDMVHKVKGEDFNQNPNDLTNQLRGSLPLVHVGPRNPPAPSFNAPDPTAAEAAIRRLGGVLQRNADLPANPVAAIYLHNTNGVHDKDLLNLAAFPTVQEVDLSGDVFVTGEGLKYLSGLTELRTLKLTQVQVKDEDLQYFAQMTHLKHLDLGATLLTDDGMKQLAKFERLQYLCLDNVPLTDKGLADLAGLKKLTMFVIRQNYRFSDAALSAFAKGRPADFQFIGR